MDKTLIIYSISTALYLILWLSLPVIIVASVVGLLVSLIQALTQIQDQTLSFGFKLIATIITLYIMADVMAFDIYNFTNDSFEGFHERVS